MRRAAARSQCANNLKQIAIAIHGYQDAHGHFPPGAVAGTQLPPDQRLSFYASLLPYLERKNIHDKLKMTEPWDSELNRLVVSGSVSWQLFQCTDWIRERFPNGGQNPSFGHDAFTNYVGVAGVGADAATRPADATGIGFFGYDRKLKLDQVKDGLSNTMMVIETGHEVGPWLRGGPSTVRAIDPSAGHLTGDGLPFGGTHFLDSTVVRKQRPHGFHIVTGDGAVYYRMNDIRPELLAALATIAGGEEIPAGW